MLGSHTHGISLSRFIVSSILFDIRQPEHYPNAFTPECKRAVCSHSGLHFYCCVILFCDSAEKVADPSNNVRFFIKYAFLGN